MKVYLIGLNNRLFFNYDWTKEADEIKALNPDRIFCIGMEEGFPDEWFDNNLFDKLIDWLEEQNKYVTIIGGFSNSIYNRYSDRIKQRILHEESLGCIFWVNASQYDIERNSYDLSKTPKLFTCYNHNHKIERALLVDELCKHNLMNDGVITLHNPNLYKNTDGSPYVWKYHDGSTLLDEIDFKLSVHGADVIPKSLKQGFFDVVTESFYGHSEFLITEKTLKSLGMARPFIALACKGYHTYLRDKLGIQLYDEMFDYSFDNCDKIEDRIAGIVNNILRLKHTLSTEEAKAKMYQSIETKLYNNLNKRKDIIWDRNLVIPKCLQFLLDDNSCILHGQKGITVIQQINAMLNRQGNKLKWADEI